MGWAGGPRPGSLWRRSGGPQRPLEGAPGGAGPGLVLSAPSRGPWTDDHCGPFLFPPSSQPSLLGPEPRRGMGSSPAGANGRYRGGPAPAQPRFSLLSVVRLQDVHSSHPLSLRTSSPHPQRASRQGSPVPRPALLQQRPGSNLAWRKGRRVCISSTRGRGGAGHAKSRQRPSHGGATGIQASPT